MLKLLVYAAVLLLVLSFFGVSFQHLVESPTTQANFAYALSLLEEGWHALVAQLSGLWNGANA